MKEELNKILEELENKMMKALKEEKYQIMYYIAGQMSVIKIIKDGIGEEK